MGIIAIFYPQVLGTGYSVIADLLSKPHPAHVLLGIGLAKLVAFATSLGSGASGGTFAPGSMIGGSLGAAFGSFVHHTAELFDHWTLWHGRHGGALRQPVPRHAKRDSFMPQVTGAYNAILPVFLVAVVADLAVHFFMRTTINTERLVRRGHLVPEAYELDPMKLLRVRDIMSPDTDTVRAAAKVADSLAAVQHESVPVVDAQDHVIGILYRRDLLNASPEATAASLAHVEFPVAYADEVVDRLQHLDDIMANLWRSMIVGELL